MKRNEALPGKYLTKDDFTSPALVAIDQVVAEKIEGEHKTKPVMYIKRLAGADIDDERGIVLNGTNWDVIAAITGEEDSDHWHGKRIVLLNDPTVTYMGKVTGGIRVRAPKADPVPEPVMDETDTPAAMDEPLSDADAAF